MSEQGTAPLPSSVPELLQESEAVWRPRWLERLQRRWPASDRTGL